MVDYTALIAAWNGVTQPPAGVTGTGLNGGMTTQQKLNAVNGWTVAGPAKPMIIDPNKIISTFVAADLLSLSTSALQVLGLVLNGNVVDASPGTQVRAVVQQVFAGKTATLNALKALSDSFDVEQIPWWRANGYTSPFNENDASKAGLS